MARHYSREELISLKESPLVIKPATLPPIEEWMGPIPDPAQNNNQTRGSRGIAKGRTDDASATDAIGGRRPGFESRKSAPAPESIVLGPPKTNFASALGKSTPRSAQEDDTGNDRKHYRDRYTRDGQRHERDEGNRREDRPAQNQHRRSTKDDADMWAGARQSRATIFEEKDKSSRPNGDRDSGRDREGDNERRDRIFDSHRREGKKDTNGEHSERRNGPLRSRDVISWGREVDKAHVEDERNRIRESRESNRRGHREQDKGWARGNSQDEDPLWLDGLDSKEDKRQAPTQADFEEFRAKMKAQDGKVQSGVTQSVEQLLGHERAESGGLTASKVKTDISLDLSDVSDRFYEILSQPKKEKAFTNGRMEESQQDLMDAAAAKMAKSSKFSSLFNVDSASKAATLSPTAEGASSEDKAGFQRILKLLDQQQQPNSGDKTPPHPLTRQTTQASPPLQSPPARPKEGIQLPPQNVVPKTRDSEFLLNLMRQPQRGQHEPVRAASGSHRDQENTSSVLPFDNNYASSSMQDPPQQTPASGHSPGFFDEPLRQERPPRDKLNPNASNHRNAPPGLYDLFNNPQRPSQTSRPPGLERRPPGFDQVPPGFGQQPQIRPPPPPGFQRQIPQNGHHGAVASGMFNGPRYNGSGMPPPGFMNLGGPPPPGFPSMGFPHDAPQFGGGGDFGFAPGFQQRR